MVLRSPRERPTRPRRRVVGLPTPLASRPALCWSPASQILQGSPTLLSDSAGRPGCEAARTLAMPFARSPDSLAPYEWARRANALGEPIEPCDEVVKVRVKPVLRLVPGRTAASVVRVIA